MLLECLVPKIGHINCALSAFMLVRSCFINRIYAIFFNIIILFVCTTFPLGKRFIYLNFEGSREILISCKDGIDICLLDNHH